jgi:ABC-type antimicrobial peptide transport system permease subunit
VAVVLKEAATATVAGMVGGVLLGRWGCTLVEHFAYQIQTSDWSITLIAVFAMVVVAALSVAAPLRRALHLSPAVALRLE